MNSFVKLKTKLAELFQLDQADLDFGIYRIMNVRQEEINRFLERDLLPKVQESFKQYQRIRQRSSRNWIRPLNGRGRLVLNRKAFQK